MSSVTSNFRDTPRISNFRGTPISREQEMRYMFFYLDITEDIVAQWGVMIDPQVLTAHT